LDESAVQRYFAANIGNTVTAAAIRRQFDGAFGGGSGDKVKADSYPATTA